MSETQLLADHFFLWPFLKDKEFAIKFDFNLRKGKKTGQMLKNIP